MNAALTTTQPQSVVSRLDRELEFIPFGSDEKIKLSARIIQDMICIPTKSGKVCSETEAMKFMMLCKARALNPFEGDAFLQGYDAKDGPVFSLITAHQAFLKRAEVHPEFAGLRSGVVLATPVECPVCKGEGQRKNGSACKACDEKGVTDEIKGDIVPDQNKLIGGWCTVLFRTRPEPMHKRVALAVFRKPFGRWEIDAAGMIVKCAEADALRSSFPTKLGGLYLREENDALEPRAPEPQRGLFGSNKPAPTQIDVSAPAATAPEPPKEPAKAADKPAAAKTEKKVEPAATTPPANPLVNDKTKLAEWLLQNNLGWGQIQQAVSQEFGNWADSIADINDLSMQQAKVILGAKDEILKIVQP